jgi:HSP20 family molecular chaperone IbpA
MADKLQRYEEDKPEITRERAWAAPAVDIYENNDEVLLVADVPGVRKDDLSIHLENEQLYLEGRMHEDESGTLLGCECPPIDYRRTFLVPPGIDGEKIAADLKHGVLYLHLPKTEALKPRRVEVKAG